jgi:hypothetical protein
MSVSGVLRKYLVLSRNQSLAKVKKGPSSMHHGPARVPIGLAQSVFALYFVVYQPPAR